MHLKTRRNAYGTVIVTAVAALAVMTLSCLVEPLDDFRRDNEVDPDSGNYQGFETVDTSDAVKAHTSEGAELVFPSFIVSELLQAEAYQLQIATAREFSGEAILHDVNTYASNVMRPVVDLGLTAVGTYFWRGRAKAYGEEFGTWTDVRSFTITTVSGIDPSDGSLSTETRPVVSWDAVEGAVLYEVQFSTNEDELFSGDIVSTSVASASFPFDLEWGDVGYWRVRARNEFGNYSFWSPVFSVITRYNVGDRGPAGGWIFYVDLENHHDWTYLEAAPAETEWAKTWGGRFTSVGGAAQHSAIGTGAANTAAIIAAYGENEPYERRSDYAARLCQTLTYGGYSDWFLPSIDELIQVSINLRSQGIGDFAQDRYWSSTEYSSTHAMRLNTHNSFMESTKSNDWRVRAVRAFAP